VFWTSMIAEEASTRLMASTASVTIIMLPAAPPNCSPTSMPMRPRSNAARMSAASRWEAFSISATRGRTSASAKAATAS
jgi:hypothetical protein